MIAWLFALFLFAGPFWESKAPADWTDRELIQLLTDSPWAQSADGPGRGGSAAAVTVFLATAAPMAQAEAEVERRAALRRKPGIEPPDDPLQGEYRAWLADHRATELILAVRVGRQDAFSEEKEVARMENESVMHVGRKKIKMTGHFPPYAGDPYLRLAFPRQVALSDKKISFDLYLPGVPAPFRTVEFTLKDMVVNGKLEL